ncbi:MAG: dephospho-CoA kinase [Clostridia bacterium]|nr:dephospho-CoA kinase [Clostridia bacterium]
MENTVLIGVCGMSGSGKSHVSRAFASLGGHHVDTDKIYHALLEPRRGKLSPCALAIAREFGDEVVKDATIDRGALGKIVYSDPDRLLALNRIAHKYIKKATLAEVRKCGAQFALIDAPVLFESGFDKLCDFTVCVCADDETRIKRIVRRDNISEDDAKRRLANQTPQSDLVSMCDFTVDNSYGRDVTEDVKKILLEKGLI